MAMEMEKQEQILNEVQAKIGETVNTLWGPSTVQKVVQEPNGNWLVHLLEFGTEPYTIKLSDWSASLQ